MITMISKIVIVVLCAAFPITASAQQDKKPEKDRKEESIFYTDIPPHSFDIIPGCPTGSSIRLSIMFSTDAKGFIKYGEQADKLNRQTQAVDFTTGKPQTVLLDKLPACKEIFYKLIYKKNSQTPEEQSALRSFVTQRKPGQSFSFCIQADSHLDENVSPEVYTQTLNNITNDKPDFLIDLGDTWMTDKYRSNFKDAAKQYIAQRYYFDKAGQHGSVFFTLGNHDGEAAAPGRKNAGEESMLAWATRTRLTYYNNPVPGDIYSGNINTEEGIGYPQNYYAWQWGDALFIVLDPFRYSKGNKTPWQRTLGQLQYEWLKKTLRESKAAFKFVFIHNLVGGVDKKGKGRGGAEAAKYFEWGGYDTSGVNQFAANRPGWDQPIHDLLAANGVNIVFHGHDHFFARQEKDGIIYQLVPQPGGLHYGNSNVAADYGYTEGNILNMPGYLRININGATARVEYVQTSTDARHRNGEVLYTYTINSKH